MSNGLTLEEIQATAFQIIAEVGDARSQYIAAINEARDGNCDAAHELIKAGGEAFLRGHAAHAKLIQSEAGGTPTEMNLILTHAEDQLMSAEGFGILAEAFIDVYSKMEKLSSN